MGASDAGSNGCREDMQTWNQYYYNCPMLSSGFSHVTHITSAQSVITSCDLNIIIIIRIQRNEATFIMSTRFNNNILIFVDNLNLMTKTRPQIDSFQFVELWAQACFF